MRTLLLACFFCFSLPAHAQLPKWKITDVENYIASSKDDVLVINFWATFCKPCIAEIPGFIRVVEKHRADSVKLLLVSLDMPSQYPNVPAFIRKHNFNAQHAWLNETDADYFCPKIDPKWSGAIPATLIVNTRTGKRLFFEEEMEEERLQEIISGMLRP